ncbi:MAG TPA: hypothetical protein VHU42_04130 [Rhodopila sp.]|jgi:hypothetical protein|nr:hypothetical protein [Rhodopila sp.]
MSIASKLGRGMSGLMVLLLALASGGLIAFSPDIALPLLLLLLPGLIALVLDRSPGCGVARAMLLFQGAACIRPVINAWYRCDGIDGCMSFLAEWTAILPVWLAGGTAWLLTQILPLGLKLLDDYRLRHRSTALLAQRQALVEEWGLED